MTRQKWCIVQRWFKNATDSDIIKSNNAEEEQSRNTPGTDDRAVVAEVVGTD